MDYAIETVALEKTYSGGVCALRGVDLRVARGSCFGLLGPNGAGKSTLVKTLLSIVRPSGGGGSIHGVDIRSHKARVGVGYLPEGHRFPSYLNAEGVCRYFGRLAGMGGAALEQQIDEKLDLVGLRAWRKTKVNKFSKGMAQRVGIAQALLGDPKLILLDEPTDGVDPIAREGLRSVLRDLNERGTTVFINSHLLSEIELLCDEVAILKDGRILQQGPIDEFTGRTKGASSDALSVSFRTGPIDAEAWCSFTERGAERAAAGAVGSDTGEKFTISLKNEQEISTIIDLLRARNIAVFAIDPGRVGLEEAFVELIRADGGSTEVTKR